MNFSDCAVLAYARLDGSLRQRLFCGVDGIYCMFLERLNKKSVFEFEVLIFNVFQSSDRGESLYWRISGDGFVVMSDDVQIIKQGCAKSFAPFPTRCMFYSETGLNSFDHLTNKMKAMTRIDSEGVICGANFKVDTFSKINGIPRRGSEANWALVNSR